MFHKELPIYIYSGSYIYIYIYISGSYIYNDKFILSTHDRVFNLR